MIIFPKAGKNGQLSEKDRLEQEIVEWRKLALERKMEAETAEQLVKDAKTKIEKEEERESTPVADIETKFKKFWLEIKDREKTSDQETRNIISAADAEKARLDLQISVNRLAAEYYMAHDGDMDGFSQYADGLFASIDMNMPELRDYFLKRATFTKIETVDDDDEFHTYAMTGDREQAIREAMHRFYDSNPAYGVNARDVDSLIIDPSAAFLNGPDGRTFSCTDEYPCKSAKAEKSAILAGGTGK